MGYGKGLPSEVALQGEQQLKELNIAVGAGTCLRNRAIPPHGQ